MKKSQPEPTRAKNFEDKFDRGEEVLNDFDLPKARVIKPRSASSGTKAKFAYPPKSNARSAVVREKSADYRKDRKASRP
jgi:hypothetical protein